MIDCFGDPCSSHCPQNSDSQLSILENSELSVCSYNFEFRSYQHHKGDLPGELLVNGNCIEQCVTAHNNVTEVANFIQNVLQYQPTNGSTAQYICSINCVENYDQIEWQYAAWLDPYEQAIFGQCMVNGKLRSLAVAQDIVAHEFFHGLTYQIVGLDYYGQSGALDESYADIFGILVANFQNSDIETWNWELGSGFGDNGRAIRSLSNPAIYGQPEHMNNYRILPDFDDYGGVHYNSGIHNKAAYYLLSSQDAEGNYLFDATSGATLFYLALSQLSKQSVFSDSRRAIQQVARTLFRQDSSKLEKLRAIATAFDNVGIGDNIGIFE
ncbi:Bacillolysin [Calothrix sp. NIES-2100]|uniref:M4 family metallopeptidase n=1 Tax=Calothrix sp. NIES-2100 TaxID=1954172 RepID=UPI000B5EF69E|nr:Bacillolysin [Calothrix sp. NIES-2100]